MSAPPIPRQQRRKLRRELVERGRRALDGGLPQPTSNDDALGIALALYDGLADTTVETRAGRLAEATQTMLDRTIARQTAGLAIDCRKGCAHCCRQRVTCTAPEIFRVAHWMRANAQRHGVPAHATLAADAAFATVDAAPGANPSRRPCVMLLDEACSIYAGRPIPCRSLLSMSASACRMAMADPATAEPVPLVTGAMDIAEVVRTLMLSAVAAHGLGDAGYDLAAGLGVALAAPGAEARWLAGEDVFAGLRRSERSSVARQVQARLAGMIRSLQA